MTTQLVVGISKALKQNVLESMDATHGSGRRSRGSFELISGDSLVQELSIERRKGGKPEPKWKDSKKFIKRRE